jgi:hypothetical protein
MKQASAYCHVCERRVLAIGKAPNHILHFLITMFTCGLWVIVWILLAAGTIGNYRCTRCGSPVSPSSGGAGRYGRGDDDDD